MNDELLSELKRLKNYDYKSENKEKASKNYDFSELDVLKSEISKLKNNLALKSDELKGLRFRNDSLEGRINQLEAPLKSPSDINLNSNPNFKSFANPSLKNKTNIISNGCDLHFDAVITSLSGKNKEAFYTEFFVLSESLEKIARVGGIDLAKYPNIASHSELWARSRKNSFLYPGVHARLRTLLLDYVDNDKGFRVRTDVDGSAVVSGLKEGNYFVIGTASLGKIGVTWDVDVVLNLGINKISLTLANCSWSL